MTRNVIKDMVGEDIRMNELEQMTKAEFVYAEAEDGSQVKIKKSDLLNLLYRYTIGGSSYQTPDDLLPGFYYKNEIGNPSIEQLYPYRDGVIIVIDINGGIVQLHIGTTPFGLTMRYRWGGTWYSNVIK